jgi:hypothetical protein
MFREDFPAHSKTSDELASGIRSSICSIRQRSGRTAFTGRISYRRAVFVGFFARASFGPHIWRKAFLTFAIDAHQLLAIEIIVIDDRWRGFWPSGFISCIRRSCRTRLISLIKLLLLPGDALQCVLPLLFTHARRAGIHPRRSALVARRYRVRNMRAAAFINPLIDRRRMRCRYQHATRQ